MKETFATALIFFQREKQTIRVLDGDAARSSLAEQIAPDDFTDPLFRRAAERIFSMLKSGKGIDLRDISIEGDDELNRLLSHYSVLEIENSDQESTDQKMNLEKTCADCVGRIKQHGSAKKMKSLLMAIHDAESRGDREQLRSLQEQIVQIRRRETQ